MLQDRQPVVCLALERKGQRSDLGFLDYRSPSEPVAGRT